MEFGETDDGVHVDPFSSLRDNSINYARKFTRRFELTNPPRKGWKRYLWVVLVKELFRDREKSLQDGDEP
jgi:hypothetical protein